MTTKPNTTIMTSDHPGGPGTDALRALLVDEVLGRIAAARTELAAGVVDSASARRLAESVHSLKGLLSQARLVELAERVHTMEGNLVAARRAGGRSEMLETLRDVGDEVRRRVAVEDAARYVPTATVVDAVAQEASRVAGRRNIALQLSHSCDDGNVPRRIAGVLIDAAGHVVRNSVVHGGTGGSVAVTITGQTHGGRVILTVVDRRDGEPGRGLGSSPPTVDAGRGVGRQAAAARLAEVGGQLIETEGIDGWTVILDTPISGSGS